MEFFEKAHVVKSNKAAENVKKQLKQMLYGYKVSDNKLIQNSADSINEYDDSTSVSGFSDLNLTKSSADDDMLDSEANIKEDTITKLIESNESSSNTDSLIKDIDSLSEENENISGDEDSDEVASAISELDVSLGSGLSESDLESNSSGDFDENGELALKIQKKLKELKIKKKAHKRKYKEIDNDDKENSEKYKAKVKDGHNLSEEELSININENAINNEDDSEQLSPPFVSITAEDMSHQPLDNILGDYKHSIIRNLSSDNKHTIFCASNSAVFANDDSMSVEVHTEDEIDSLIPEFDDIPTVEEIEEDFINLDTTIDTNPNDTVIELENTLESEPTSDVEQFIETQMNVQETYKIYYTQLGCIVVLKQPSELYIHGKVKIKRLGGTIEIFGYTLKDEFYELYAPYYHFAQSVKTIENPNAYYGLFGKLTSAGLSVSEAENIVTSIGDQDGVMLLQPLHSEKIEFIENNFKVTYLFNKLNKVIEPYFKNASDILKCSLYSIRPLNSFRIHPNWGEALLHAEKPGSIGLVCGGKGAGKSTYLRYQVNKLIGNGPVLVVDLDPGQCEFTVAGNISASVVTSPLLGPNFTHLKKPDITLNIGMINTMDNSKRYLSAVHTLISQCRENEAYANMPWIVNTMGMTTALGLKFITFIILQVKPTYVLQYESKVTKKNFNTLLRPNNIRLLYEDYKKSYLFENRPLPANLNYSFIVAYETDKSVKDSFTLTPKDERYLNFLAYFSQLASIQKNLLGITPYQASLKDLYVATNVIVEADSITKVINGKVVALCQQKQCDSTRVFTLADKPLLCHGHGIIRGIDWEKEILYVITPVMGSELCGVNTLVYADWVPDLVGQETQLPEGTVVPYRTRRQDQIKQLMSTPHRRFNPLQLLKITRSAKIESLVN